MAEITCEVGDFYANVMSMYEADLAELEKDAQEEVYAAADDTVKHLREDIGKWSQVEDLPDGRAKLLYERGWKAYKYEMRDGRVEAVVANKNAPGLTHLIEKSHELFVYGHDTGKQTKARPHIKEAYEYAVSRHFTGGDVR